MKNIYIIHGWGGSPKEPLICWLKTELEKAGHKVVAPEMPDTEHPVIAKWVGKLKEVVIEPNEDTVFIGHSIGCQTILRYLADLPETSKIDKLILIAPWMELDLKTIEEEGEGGLDIAYPWMETPINFDKVQKIVSKTIAIFSDNDPFVPLSQKDLFEEKLNAEIVLENNKGHFDPESNIVELPIVLAKV